MLSPRTNRLPLTRPARFLSLGVVALLAVLVASLQAATAAEQPPPANPSESQTTSSRMVSISGGVTINVEDLAEMAAILAERLQPVRDQMQALLDDPESGISSFQLTFTGRLDAPAGPAAEEPIRIGKNGVPHPIKIHNVPPVYPPAARTAGIQGLVILEVTIAPTGEVGDIQVLKSVPELDEAAIAAVEQWRYEPTLVDDVPVPALMTVTINFSPPSR